jgi:hypothetical protein
VSSPLPALERFASNSGFKIIIEDFDFRYVFIPGERPSDYEEYQREDVPVEKPPDA